MEARGAGRRPWPKPDEAAGGFRGPGPEPGEAAGGSWGLGRWLEDGGCCVDAAARPLAAMDGCTHTSGGLPESSGCRIALGSQLLGAPRPEPEALPWLRRPCCFACA